MHISTGVLRSCGIGSHEAEATGDWKQPDVDSGN